MSRLEHVSLVTNKRWRTRCGVLARPITWPDAFVGRRICKKKIKT